MSIIKKPTAVDSPYAVTPPAPPTRLASAPVAGGGVSTVAASAAPVVSSVANANVEGNAFGVGTSANVSYYAQGLEGVNELATYGRIFAGANVTIQLEKQEYITYNQNYTGNGTVGGANGQIQFNNNGNFDGSPALTFDGANIVVAGIKADNYYYANGQPFSVNLGNFSFNGDQLQNLNGGSFNNGDNLSGATAALNLPTNGVANSSVLLFNLYGNIALETGNNTGVTTAIWNFNQNGNVNLPSGGVLGNPYGDNANTAGLQAGPGGYAIINSNDQKQYVQADDTSVYIGTDYPDNNYLWTFDKSGNLTLPTNSSSINYANGQPYGGGGGGNTFASITMANTPMAASNVIQYGLGNLISWLDGEWTIGEFNGNLSAPNSGLGNEGIRIDPGIESNAGMTIPGVLNQSSQPLYIYSGAGGGIQLYPGGSGSFVFAQNGNLTLPTNSSNINYANGVSILDGISGGGGNAAGGNGDIQFNNNGAFGAAMGFNFDGYNLNVPGNLQATGNVSATAFLGTQANVDLVAGGNTWVFDTTGNLTTPTNLVIGPAGGAGTQILQTDNQLAVIGVGANAFAAMGWVESNDSPGNVAAIEFNVPYSGATGNVAILTGPSISPNTWMFDNTGNLNLPGYSTIENQVGSGTLTLYPDRNQPDYGVQSFISFDNDIHLQSANIDKGIALGRSYGSGPHIRIVGNVPSNPGDLPGNITIHAQDYEGGTAQEWHFGTDGNLTTPAGAGDIAMSGGNITGANVLNANSIYTTSSGGDITMTGGNITGVNNITATGNIYPGNILTDGYYYANGAPFVSSNYGDSNVTSLLASFGSNTITTSGNITAGNFIGAGANTDIVAGSYDWTFDNTGNLMLPNIGGTIEATITTVNGALQVRSNIGTEMDYYDSADPDNHWGYISIDGTGTYIAQRSNVAGNVSTVDWTFDPTGNLVTTGNLKLVTNSNLWNFDTNGALTFPGNTLQIGLIGGSSGLNNINGSNITINTDGNLWTFATDGNLYTPEGGQIRASSQFYGISVQDYSGNSFVSMDSVNMVVQGNAAVTLSTNGGTQFVFTNGNLNAGNANISTTGNITSGNLTTGIIHATTITNLDGTLTIQSGSGYDLVFDPIAANISAGSNWINNLANPQQPQDAATKKYVDDNAAGLNIHDPALLASTQDLATYTGATVTYNNGTAGVGATLSLVGNTLTTLDGTAITGGSSTRLLIKNEANAVYNGVYTYTSNTVLTRATDMDQPSELTGGDYVFVQTGVTQASSSWVQQGAVGNVGVGNVNFVQFSASQSYSAGNALALTGSQFNVKVDNSTVIINGSNQLEVGTVPAANVSGLATVATSGLYSDLTGAYGNANVADYLPTYTGNLVNLGGDVATSGNVSASGNVIAGGNVNAPGGFVNAAAVITSGRIDVGTNLSAVGDVTGNNFSATGTVTVSGGTSQVKLNNGTQNWIEWNNAGYGAPQFTTRSPGSKLLLSTEISGSRTDYAVGVEPYYTWFGVPISDPGYGWKWYGGTTQIASLTSTGALSTTGNITGNYILGNGAFLSGVASSYGNANVATFLAAYGSNTISSTGNITTTANISGGYILGNGSQLTGLPASYGDSNVVTLMAAFGSNTVSTSGNVTSGNLLTGGVVSATGNVTGGNLNATTGIANVANLYMNTGYVNTPASTGINLVPGSTATGTRVWSKLVPNANVAFNLGSTTEYWANGYIGNLIATTLSATGNIDGGNLRTGGLITATGNITGGNVLTGGLVSAAANVTGGNILTGGLISSTGNITSAGNISGSYILGNGSQLTGITSSYGNANVASFLAVYGSNTISSTGTVTTTANITGGNLLTTGLISATGTITGSSHLGSVVSVTANITGGNILTGGLISATGTITTASNLAVNGGVISTTATTANVFNATPTTVNIAGNATVATNIGNASGVVSLSGNVQGSTNGFAIGYRDIPQVTFSANATIVLSDAGKHYYSTSSSNLVMTIANSSTANFAVGTAINLINQGTGTITVAQGSGVTMYLAGNSTSGNRTVSSYGVATIQKVATDTWFIVGVGLT